MCSRKKKFFNSVILEDNIKPAGRTQVLFFYQEFKNYRISLIEPSSSKRLLKFLMIILSPQGGHQVFFIKNYRI